MNNRMHYKMFLFWTTLQKSKIHIYEAAIENPNTN